MRRHGTNKYWASFRVGLVSSMEYRFDFFMNLLSTIFPIILQVFLWITMYGSSRSGVMYDYTFPQMMLYVVLAGAISKFTSTGIEYVVNEDIHTGGISKYITKPISYVYFRLTGTIGQKFPAMITMVIFSTLSLTVLKLIVGFHIDAMSVLMFVPALLLAVVLNFCIYFCISTLAFWLTEIGNFFHAINVVVMVLSGGVFPINVFGKEFVSIAKFTPLTYTINYPIQILAGTVSTSDALMILGMQAAWVLILALLSNVLWNRGIKQYVAIGG
jgi:ABC-2 type transport system permease protein